MSEVEQLAQEQFDTFKTRLCEILSEIEEEIKSAFIQGYAKGETDEKFRTKQLVTQYTAKLEKENAELKKDLKSKDLALEDFTKGSEARLIKVKELLERFLGLGNLWNLDCKDYFPLRKEVEQFLKEE